MIEVLKQALAVEKQANEVLKLPLEVALHYLQAHTCIVIRTLPESSLVVLSVDGAVGVYRPVPLAVLVVNEVGLDVVPATFGNGKIGSCTKVLP